MRHPKHSNVATWPATNQHQEVSRIHERQIGYTKWQTYLAAVTAFPREVVSAVLVAGQRLSPLRQTALAHSFFGSCLCVSCFCLKASTVASASAKGLLAFKAALEDKFATGEPADRLRSLVCQRLCAVHALIADQFVYCELCHLVFKLHVRRYVVVQLWMLDVGAADRALQEAELDPAAAPPLFQLPHETVMVQNVPAPKL